VFFQAKPVDHIKGEPINRPGIENFVFDSLRYMASTIMVSQAPGNGVGLAAGMKVLGHSQVKTTRNYLHADFDRMRKALEILKERTGN